MNNFWQYSTRERKSKMSVFRMVSAVHGLASRWCWGGTQTAAGHISRIFATEMTKQQMAAWTIPFLHIVMLFVITVVTNSSVSNDRNSKCFK
jgi:hypothetical protein